ncbi:MAG: gfo/Idh/MocA family oxidoreductase, partial [Rhodobacteraceae bacterium]|nr:gfo/Idh/MocA family oxidoreductase [Paracoccaceae bacterium]
VVVSPRQPKGPMVVDIPVDPTLLAAGDHNGSTFYQHVQFQRMVRGERTPEVTLFDGAQAVRMGQAAQDAALNRRIVEL